MIVPTARGKKKTGLSINKNNVNKLKSKRRTRERAAATRHASSFSQLWITSQCFAWFSPVCPPKLIFTSLLQSAVLISDAGMSPGVLQSCPLFSRFNISVFKPAVTLSVQRLESRSITSSMFPELVPVCIFISPSFFPQANCEKGLEHILMQLCMSAAYLCYLLSEVLLSPSYAVTDVGLFIMTRIFIVNRVVFFKVVPPVLVSSSTVCPSVPSTSAALHVANERMLWESFLTRRRIQHSASV